jgi:oligopeptide transport system substrate-binding protein
VANSIKNTLGIDCVATGIPTFATYNDKLEANEIKGIFRNAWQMDYPSIENFLAPIYGTGADSNYARYSSKKFDSELSQAAAAPSVDAANTLYQQAEETLATDFPTAPLWDRSTQVGWSNRVTDVKVTAFGTLDLTAIKLK